jgi:hypothetical protein
MVLKVFVAECDKCVTHPATELTCDKNFHRLRHQGHSEDVVNHVALCRDMEKSLVPALLRVRLDEMRFVVLEADEVDFVAFFEYGFGVRTDERFDTFKTA